MELTQAGAVAEIHIYQKGRHGFGSGFGSPSSPTGWRARSTSSKMAASCRRRSSRAARAAGSAGALAFAAGSRGASRRSPAGARRRRVVNDGYGDFVLVPAGAFRMGDNFGDGESRERPVHYVELDAFYIGKYRDDQRRVAEVPRRSGLRRSEILAGRTGRCRRIRSRTGRRPNNHGGGTPDSDNYPVLGVNWDSARRLLQLAQRQDRQEVSPADRGRMGEGGARHRSAAVSRGATPSTARYANYVGAQTFDTGRAGRLLRRQQARRLADPQQRVAVRRVRHGRQRHGVVPGLVQPGLLRDVAAQESEGAGERRVSRGARRTFFMEPFDLRSYARSAAWPSFQGHRMIGFRAAREP